MAKPFRSKKLTDSAKDVCCIRCGKEGETRACHYNGFRQHSYGKGRGQKANDLMSAEFCHVCDQEFSEGKSSSVGWENWDRSEEFLHWIALTNIRRIERGIIKVS